MASRQQKGAFVRFDEDAQRDIHNATIQAESLVSKKGRDFQVLESDLDKIPIGSRITVEPAVFHKLSVGQIVYVRSGNELRLRHFLKVRMNGPNTDLLVTEGKEREFVKSGALVGKVTKVKIGDKEFDPNKQNIIEAIQNRFTDYGSLTMIEKFLGKK